MPIPLVNDRHRDQEPMLRPDENGHEIIIPLTDPDLPLGESDHLRNRPNSKRHMLALVFHRLYPQVTVAVIPAAQSQ
jgi:hypothetical protein